VKADECMEGVARDEHGLTEGQRMWLDKFNREGGQVIGLTGDQIRGIMQHGMVAIMELLLGKSVGSHKEDVYLPVGTVCALSPSPCGPWEGGRLEQKKKRGSAERGHGVETHEMFPNLDLRDLLFPDPLIQTEIIPGAKRGLTDYRSSVRGPLSTDRLLKSQTGTIILDKLGGSLPVEWEGFNARQLGIAALGKRVNVHAMGDDKDYFTFNIGTVKTMDKAVVGLNAPSIQHNNYAEPWAWRNYHNIIVPDLVYVCWLAYRSNMERVRSWSEDLLRGKGHDMGAVMETCERIKGELATLIKAGRHASIGRE